VEGAEGAASTGALPGRGCAKGGVEDGDPLRGAVAGVGALLSVGAIRVDITVVGELSVDYERVD